MNTNLKTSAGLAAIGVVFTMGAGTAAQAKPPVHRHRAHHAATVSGRRIVSVRGVHITNVGSSWTHPYAINQTTRAPRMIVTAGTVPASTEAAPQAPAFPEFGGDTTQTVTFGAPVGDTSIFSPGFFDGPFGNPPIIFPSIPINGMA